ncbi:MAG: mannose-6-phosphate isomerase [Bacteroidales bacterium]|nr:mannose-6-phosphate isomerase [Bacteroidales bacterium]
MENIYPLKFKPVLKERIWAGSQLSDLLGKKLPGNKKYGESWEISGVQGDISRVSNGFLAGNDLQELIEIYMGDLVGESIYDQFGIEFPLLIKFIDAAEPLSVQVHPDDALARKRHNSYGKTEMWYVMHAAPESEMISGFNQPMDQHLYRQHLKEKTLSSVLHAEKVSAGDVLFIPAGRVHAIGAGIMVAEIQQTSDVTYRIYDWDRVDASGNSRELHSELAVDCMDYSKTEGSCKTSYQLMKNKTSEILTCPYFTTNVLSFDKTIGKDYFDLDSFVIYICLEGDFLLKYEGGSEQVHCGETILLPAIMDQFTLTPKSSAKLLEVYIQPGK